MPRGPKGEKCPEIKLRHDQDLLALDAADA
jgi:hypothetical protein